MDKEKKAYYVNVIEADDNRKMAEVMNFNFGGHHDLVALVAKAKASGMFSEDKYAKEFVLGMRLLHHAMKKSADNAIIAEFIPQFKAFKDKVKAASK